VGWGSPVRQTVLEKTYSRFNRKYFGKKLPKVSEVDLHWADNIPDMGYEWGGEIVLNARYRHRESVWKLTLLHEMVHLGLPNAKEDHGKEFKKEMLRLAKAGAFKGLW
jgi:hypothetical protein